MVPSRFIAWSIALCACTHPPPQPAQVLDPAAQSPSPIIEPLAASPGPARLAARDMLDDLGQLRAIYQALHPGLYRYNTASTVDALFATPAQHLSSDRSLGEYYLAMTRLTAQLRCGHSYPNFGNQPEAIRDALFEGPRLPFGFRWLADEMVVTESLTSTANLAPGTVIETLGGVSAPELLAALLPLARADGSNDGKRRTYLEVSAHDSYEAFELLAPLVFPSLWTAVEGQPTMLRLSIRAPDGSRSERVVEMMTAKARAELLAKRGGEPGREDALWQLEHREHAGRKIAYLRMRSWVAYKTKWDWKSFLHETMRQLATSRAPALIVDLRGNEGGNDVGDVILAHRTTRKIAARTTVRRVRFATVPEPLRPMLDTWDDSFFELGARARPVAAFSNGGSGGDWRELARDRPDDDFIVPTTPRFAGKLIVLIDAANSSATFQFAATVKRHKLGVLVGTTTGGNQRGINGGAFFFARLPKTKLEIDVPLVGTFPASGEAPDAGISPDWDVPTTPADLARGHDAALARALELAIAR
ncbi:MAG: S41 family peptidase [Kofleriaceae bacterium]